VSTVSTAIRTFSNQRYRKESGSTLRSSDWPKSLQPSDISDIFPPLNHFSMPMNPSSLTLKTGEATTFEMSK
jgi:hypothetical protein